MSSATDSRYTGVLEGWEMAHLQALLARTMLFFVSSRNGSCRTPQDTSAASARNITRLARISSSSHFSSKKLDKTAPILTDLQVGILILLTVCETLAILKSAKRANRHFVSCLRELLQTLPRKSKEPPNIMLERFSRSGTRDETNFAV